MTNEEIDQLADRIAIRILDHFQAQPTTVQHETNEQETQITKKKKNTKLTVAKYPPVASWAKPYEQQLADLEGQQLADLRSLLMLEGRTKFAVDNQVVRAKKAKEIRLAKERLQAFKPANN